MYLAIIDLMVALEEGHVRNEGWGLRNAGADKWVPAPALPVAPSPSYGILCALQWQGVLHWGRHHFCIRSGAPGVGGPREFPVSSPVGVVIWSFLHIWSFFTSGGPPGTWGSLELRGSLEVVVWQVRSVCAKFGMDGGNGCGDMSRTKV